MVIFLTRTYFPDGTNGQLECEGKFISYTIELPWRNNEKRVCCIPKGKYLLRKRYSPKFKWHLEIVDVPNRSFILFHSANYAQSQLSGCIAPVTKLCEPGMGLLSRNAFNRLKKFVYKALNEGKIVELIITSNY